MFVASHAPDGILAFDWDPANATLTLAGVAAKVPNVSLACAFARLYLFRVGTGYVQWQADWRSGELSHCGWRVTVAFGSQLRRYRHLSRGRGCDGRMLLAADYTGASAASFQIGDGKLSEAVWTEHYTEHGPNVDRQEKAHAHFASFSPDNRFAYINDLGGDCIHIYRADPATAQMTAAGTYRGVPGSGARTLHFHPNGRTAYCMNELVSTVDVLDWHKADGSLTLVDRIDLLPADYHGPTRGCDTVITRDGRFVYFANRDDDFLYAFKADAKTGKLTPMKRSNCGGRRRATSRSIPRNDGCWWRIRIRIRSACSRAIPRPACCPTK